MKKSLLLLAISIPSISISQVFYTETFDGASCPTSGCDPIIVLWTNNSVGTNGATANTFYVSDTESGMGAGQCGAANQNDQSLHIGNVAGSAAASLFCPNGDCGAAYDASSSSEVTDKRCESPTINCTGQNNITLAFNYIENGQAALDNASVWYFDGVSWAFLYETPKTNNSGCAGQGRWTASGPIALPSSANNNPNVKIGFRWVNNGDGNGSDPSFAVDDVTLTSSATSPPTASFTASNQSICTGECIDFTNTSSGSPFTSTSWAFTGAQATTSTDNNPVGICYSNAGTFAVSLTVVNANGTDTETQTNYITVTTCSQPPVASFSANSQTICVGGSVTFTDLSTNNPTSWSWTFAGGTPSVSTSQNPTIVYNTAGNYTVSLTATNAAGSNTSTQNAYITVVNCPPPTSSFSVSDNSICEGQCISITNTSTDGTSFAWTFTGGNPSSSTAENPGTICYPTAGNYTISLTVTNSSGNATSTENIVVSVTPSVVASGDTTIDIGNTAILSAVGSGSGNYTWTPSTGVNCTTCPSTSVLPQESTYYVVEYSEGGCSVFDSVLINVNITEAIGIPNAFSPNGDGENDVLYVLGQGIFELHLKIYNRYGQLVFESNDQAQGWDGKHAGKDANTGVFAYTLEYTLSSGAILTSKGNVTLVR